MHYTPLNIPPSYPIGAIYKNTAPAETSPWVMPGTYTVQLNIDGKIFSQQLTVGMDPRVKTSVADLQKQHDLSLQCYEGRKKCIDVLSEIKEYKTTFATQDSAKTRQLTELESSQQGSQAPSFGRLNGNFAALQNILQETEMPPTTQTIAAVKEAQKQLTDLLKKWNELNHK